MGYKLCPKCEINFIDDSENLCSECSGIKKTEKNNSLFASDYSQIRKGIVYGSNSHDIYEKFCNTLGWDYSQINKFGRQKPLYATNADTDRKRAVWLIFYAILLAFPAEKWYNENNKIFQEGRLYGRIRPFRL